MYTKLIISTLLLIAIVWSYIKRKAITKELRIELEQITAEQNDLDSRIALASSEEELALLLNEAQNISAKITLLENRVKGLQ